jgi:hypothetical protein
MKLRHKDKNKKTVKRNIKFFTYQNQYFELIEFTEPKKNFLILQCETEKGKEINFPPFIDGPFEEVTSNTLYYTYEIAS